MHDTIDESKVTLCFGLCCCNIGLYTESCLGVSCEDTILCFDSSFCCKTGQEPLWCQLGGDKILQIGCGICAVALVFPTTCIKSQNQVCCVVHSCAVPSDREVPMTLAIAGCACMPEFGFCVPLSRFKGGAPQAPEAVTGAEPMDR